MIDKPGGFQFPTPNPASPSDQPLPCAVCGAPGKWMCTSPEEAKSGPTWKLECTKVKTHWIYFGRKLTEEEAEHTGPDEDWVPPTI